MLRSLDRWWFGYGSPVTLGVFRILMGSLTFANLAMVALYFDSWFTERGFVPQAIAHQYAGDDWRINLLSSVTSTPLTAAFYGLVMVAALLTTVGLWTRASSIVLAVGVITLHHRSMLILNGGDTLMRLCLVYLAIAPAGAACSLDRLLALWRGKATPVHAPVPLLGQRLVQYNVALLYLTTVWHKRGGTYWFDGTATWFPHQLREFDRFWLPQGLVDNLLFIKLTTYGTLFTELALATLVFYRPFRKWVLLAGLAMHGFIEYRFNIPLFALLTVSTYVCFYEGEEVQGWFRRLGERWSKGRLRMLAPSGMRLSVGPGQALAAADPLGLVEYGVGDGAQWRAEGAGGAPVARPFAASLQRTLGALPFTPLLGFGRWRRLLDSALEPAGASRGGGSGKPAGRSS